MNRHCFSCSFPGSMGLILGIAITFGCSTLCAAPSAVTLADDGRALHSVTVAEGASGRVREAAESLARYLSAISGAAFSVQTGDGATGIAVGSAQDFPALGLQDTLDAESDATRREDYLLRSHDRGLLLIGATDLAAQHAVWDLLHRLGYRQFFPGGHWEVVPKSPTITVAVDDLEHPDYYGRRVWYGFGDWSELRRDKANWDIRNRMANGIAISSGHAYDRIYRQYKAVFDAHPEYLCSVKPVKFCISNPELRQLVVDYAIRYFEEHPGADSISLEPSDGGGWECPRCEKVFASVSDRVATLVNQVAETVNARFKNKYVAIYAYYQHSPPPSIRLHPNVAVGVATSFIKGGFTVDQLLAGWHRQGAVLGIRDYYSVVISHKDRPGGTAASDVRRVAANIARYHRQGARFISAESSNSWGPLGLTYYVASRLYWDTSLDPQAIIDDFLDKAFGDAREPMRQFYDLIDRRNRPLFTRDLLGRMYRLLDQARSLTDDPAVHARLDDLVLYTRYAELLLELGGARDRMAATGAALGFAYRIRHTHMVHSLALWRDTRGGFARPTGDMDWKVPEGKNPWKDSSPFSRQEIDAILAEGIARNPLMSFEPVAFSEDLVPAGKRLGLTTDKPGFYGYTRGAQMFYVWLDQPGTLRLTLTGGHIGVGGTSTVTLYAVDDPTLEASSSATVPNDKSPHEVELVSRFAGLHRLHIRDGGKGLGVRWPQGTPVSVPTSDEVRTLLRHRWNMYFYVPRGTKVIGGYAGTSGGNLLDPDGNRVPLAGDGTGYFAVTVPPGQDGKLWQFVNTPGYRLLMTVPPYFARSADELLLPREVVEADATDDARE